MSKNIYIFFVLQSPAAQEGHTVENAVGRALMGRFAYDLDFHLPPVGGMHQPAGVRHAVLRCLPPPHRRPQCVSPLMRHQPRCVVPAARVYAGTGVDSAFTIHNVPLVQNVGERIGFHYGAESDSEFDGIITALVMVVGDSAQLSEVPVRCFDLLCGGDGEDLQRSELIMFDAPLLVFDIINRFALFSGRVSKDSDLFNMNFDPDSGRFLDDYTAKGRLEFWLLAEKMRRDTQVHTPRDHPNASQKN